jgi:hypothetical protein
MAAKPKPVSDAGRAQLLGYLTHERRDQETTREWIETWLDAWCKKPPTIDELIERSSLGTPAAKAIRTKTSKADVGRALKRARAIDRKNGARKR